MGLLLCRPASDLVIFDQGTRRTLYLRRTVAEGLCWHGQRVVAPRGLEDVVLLLGPEFGARYVQAGVGADSAHLAIIGSMTLPGTGSGMSHPVALALGDDLGCECGALVVDAVNRLSHHLGIGVQGPFGLFAQVAVYIIPVI